MTTQQYLLDTDIAVCAVKASSFPEGITAAFHQLAACIPANSKMWGLSRPEQGGAINYWAAAETDNAHQVAGCTAMTIAKGKYLGIELRDFMKDPQQVGAIFQLLLHSPGMDPNGYCVERYINDKDIICMVRLRD